MAASPPTGPPAATEEDIRRWRQLMDDEREFRDRTSSDLGWLKATLGGMKEDMAAHAAEDRAQFRRERRARRRLSRKVDALGGQVTQTVNTSKQNWGIIFTWFAAVAFVVGALWAVWTAFGKPGAP